MKILLSWARRPSDPDIGILIDRLEKEGNPVVYFVGAPTDKTRASGATFHSYIDAGKAIPAPTVDPSQFEPMGKDTIRKLYHVESIVLTMMNRFFDPLCVDERRRIYYEMLRYWRGVLLTFTPDAVIFPNMPHFVYDYILYELAHLLGIKTILFDDTRFPGRLLMFTDFEQLTQALKTELARADGRSKSARTLAEDIREYYEPRSRRDFNAIPSYIEYQKKKYTLWQFNLPWVSIKKSLRDLSFVQKAPRYIGWLFREKSIPLARTAYTHLSYPFLSNLKKEYTALERPPDFSKRFVYFPLQMQPEKTTSPQGNMFVDQLLALETVSAAVPAGVSIYVKEHPLQWLRFGIRFNSSRYRGYYARIARMKNVMLIPLYSNSYQLINKSIAVSAVTGSAGWEAALRGKPSIIFGTVWYQDCPGVFSVFDTESCRQAFETIRNGYVVGEQRVISYLHCFERVTIRAFIAPTAGRVSTVSKEECMRNISEAVIQELKK